MIFSQDKIQEAIDTANTTSKPDPCFGLSEAYFATRIQSSADDYAVQRELSKIKSARGLEEHFARYELNHTLSYQHLVSLAYASARAENVQVWVDVHEKILEKICTSRGEVREPGLADVARVAFEEIFHSAVSDGNAALAYHYLERYGASSPVTLGLQKVTGSPTLTKIEQRLLKAVCRLGLRSLDAPSLTQKLEEKVRIGLNRVSGESFVGGIAILSKVMRVAESLDLPEVVKQLEGVLDEVYISPLIAFPPKESALSLERNSGLIKRRTRNLPIDAYLERVQSFFLSEKASEDWNNQASTYLRFVLSKPLSVQESYGKVTSVIVDTLADRILRHPTRVRSFCDFYRELGEYYFYRRDLDRSLHALEVGSSTMLRSYGLGKNVHQRYAEGVARQLVKIACCEKEVQVSRCRGQVFDDLLQLGIESLQHEAFLAIDLDRNPWIALRSGQIAVRLLRKDAIEGDSLIEEVVQTLYGSGLVQTPELDLTLSHLTARSLVLSGKSRFGREILEGALQRAVNRLEKLSPSSLSPALFEYFELSYLLFLNEKSIEFLVEPFRIADKLVQHFSSQSCHSSEHPALGDIHFVFGKLAHEFGRPEGFGRGFGGAQIFGSGLLRTQAMSLPSSY